VARSATVFSVPLIEGQLLVSRSMHEEIGSARMLHEDRVEKQLRIQQRVGISQVPEKP
jgi:hypothetical protein